LLACSTKNQSREFALSLRAKRSNLLSYADKHSLDCFVALRAPRNDNQFTVADITRDRQASGSAGRRDTAVPPLDFAERLARAAMTQIICRGAAIGR
jgi:hypothetical protein